MILSGKRIGQLVADKVLVIDPFDPARLNANSYNLALDKHLKIYTANLNWHQRFGRDTSAYRLPEQWNFYAFNDTQILDMKKDNETVDVEIPEGGIILYPGILYLGSTVEYTKTPPPYAPMLEGRSSIGRIGMEVHVTAGFGDSGFSGHWTCEIRVTTPLRVYAGVQICQINYHEVTGEIDGYRGKYQGQRGPKPSGIWKEFLPKEKT